MEAHRTDPRQADYEGLEAYMVHMQEANTGVLRAGKFANHIADRQKSQSNILKQFRLAQEETVAQNKKKKGGKGAGKDDPPVA